MLLMYLTAYMNITVRAPAFETQSQLMLVHYTLGLITPIGQLLRSVFVGLNLFSVLCSGSPPIKATSPGLMPLFGSPILYLIGQSVFFLGILVWSDHDFSSLGWHGATSIIDSENPTTHEPEVLEENDRVSRSNDGLRVLHANKTFRTMAIGWNKVIKDLSFGVKRGEVFALVGPNGGTLLSQS
jgi:ATP-binding cassette subfamily A (ABC1) protein 3